MFGPLVEAQGIARRRTQRQELDEWMQAVDVEPGRTGEDVSAVLMRVAVATKRHAERALAPLADRLAEVERTAHEPQAVVTREDFDAHVHTASGHGYHLQTGTPEVGER